MRLTEVQLHIISDDLTLRRRLKDSLRSIRHISFGNLLSTSSILPKKYIDILLVDIHTPGCDSFSWIQKVIKFRNPSLGEVSILLFTSTSLENFDIQQIDSSKYIQNIFFMSSDNDLFMNNFKFFIKTETQKLSKIRKMRLLELRLTNLQKQLNMNEFLLNSDNLPIQPFFLKGISSVIKNIDKKLHYYASSIEKKHSLLALFEEQIFHDEIVEYLWQLRNTYHPLGNKSSHKVLPFVKVDFKEIPPLFHHFYVLGSSDYESMFQEAAKGILFIQQIEFLSLPLQQELCRILDIGVMGPKNEKIQCVVIISASLTLEKLIFSDKLLQQLFAKLESNILLLPNLSERPDDIRYLIESFCESSILSNYPKKYKYHPLLLEYFEKDSLFTNYQEMIKFLSDFEKVFGHLFSNTATSSNVSFVFEQDLFLLCLKKFLNDHQLTSQFLIKKLIALYETLLGTEYLSSSEQFINKYISSLPTLKKLEKSYIHYVLNKHKGNISETARILGVSRKTLYSKVDR